MVLLELPWKHLDGIILMKMVDNVGMLKGIFTAVKGITDFIADVGIKLVDGLATFVDWGYKTTMQPKDSWQTLE